MRHREKGGTYTDCRRQTTSSIPLGSVAHPLSKEELHPDEHGKHRLKVRGQNLVYQASKPRFKPILYSLDRSRRTFQEKTETGREREREMVPTIVAL